MKSVLLLVLLSAPALSALVFADEPQWQNCHAIADDAARLACYDALASAQAPAAAAAAVTTTLVTLTSPDAVSVPVESAPAGSPAVVAVTKAEREQTAAEFGLEHKVAEAQLEQIVSRIPGAFRGWQAKTKFTLENGQVWQIADGSHGIYQLQDPAVVIERGVFGTFFLKIEGANRSPKVKRLK